MNALTNSQTITSAKTSIPQVPALHKWALRNGYVSGFSVLDFGCGAYSHGLDFLMDNGARYVAGYDPYNMSPAANARALRTGYDVVLMANVLNVIDSPEAREEALRLALYRMMYNGCILVSVYEGNGSGVGRATSKGWQANRKLATYIAEIQAALGQLVTVVRKGSVLIIRPA